MLNSIYFEILFFILQLTHAHVNVWSTIGGTILYWHQGQNYMYSDEFGNIYILGFSKVPQNCRDMAAQSNILGFWCSLLT